MGVVANPLTVEVLRGELVESRHRGSAIVVDAGGKVHGQWGNVSRAIYPRSAMKALQALAMVESGAAEALALSDAQVALTCASHNGEPEHVAGASAVLQRLGLSESDLECGPHWPSRQESAHALVQAGQTPTQLHNNCSGKHVGMLSLASHLGEAPAGYIEPAHGVQQRIRATLESMCDVSLGAVAPGVDGCSAPNWPIPLERLAYGFARFADPTGLARPRIEAIERIQAAVFAHPFMVDGTDGFCTEVMRILRPRAFVKTGAEGVFCAALPELGLGIALKCDDGARRGAQVMIATLLQHLGVVRDGDLEAMAHWLQPPLHNCNARLVGHLRAAPAWDLSPS